jgi:hypothetical protein
MNDNPGSFCGLALHFDGAVMLFNDLLHIAESKAKSFDIMCISRRNAVKLFKDMFQVLPRDANSVV